MLNAATTARPITRRSTLRSCATLTVCAAMLTLPVDADARRKRGPDAGEPDKPLVIPPEVKARFPGATFVKRGQKPPSRARYVVLVDSDGHPIQTRIRGYAKEHAVREGETVRSIAYRYATSPRAVAMINEMPWRGGNMPLQAGSTIKVPVRSAAADRFAENMRLESGPGVHSERRTNWGRPRVVRLLREAFAAIHRRWPERHPAVCGSLSRFGGGRLRPHRSHRDGSDIDIGYFTRQHDRNGWGVPPLGAIDYERLWAFVDLLERSGEVAQIYMSPRIQRQLYRYARSRGASERRLKTMFQYGDGRRPKVTMIRHSRGHRDHLHIRFETADKIEELRS
jgi:hypothetical protein